MSTESIDVPGRSTNVVLIGAPGATGPAPTPEQVGSKAAELWALARLELPVPPAFVLPTALCAAINAGQPAAGEALELGLRSGMRWLERSTGRRFGDSRAPLLVSVRSGAARSMPGMMQTVLNVGLNDQSLRGLIQLSGNPRLAFDCYRRSIQSYAEVVGGAPADAFEQRLGQMLSSENVPAESRLDPEALERLADDFRELAERLLDQPLPQDPAEQLLAAARAVYRSWESSRAREYRRLNALQGLAGTAVTVQAMVYGNAGPRSGAGVAFSRDPATGENRLYVDFLFDAQGEDLVSGRRTPGDIRQLAARLPAVAVQLEQGVRHVEHARRDAQDIEFTVEEGRLYFLQTRAAARTTRAALRIAVDMVHEGLIDQRTAVERLADLDASALSTVRFSEAPEPIATAISASCGVACGRVAFDSRRAGELASAGHPVILVRPEISPEDVAGFAVAEGILSAVGGRTAHAAVIARQLGKVCLVGCNALHIDPQLAEAQLGQAHIREGDWLCLDANRGEISLGRRKILREAPPELEELQRWRIDATVPGQNSPIH